MHVDIPEYLFPHLKKAARALNIPISELVTDAVIAYIEDLKNSEDALRDYRSWKKAGRRSTSFVTVSKEMEQKKNWS
jgi:hypothetical protein